MTSDSGLDSGADGVSVHPVADGVVELGRTAARDRSGPIDAAGSRRLETLIRAAAEEVLAGGAVHRVQLRAPEEDRWLRRAALRAGFRVEGVRRAVLPRPGGGFADETLFARLAGDEIGGPVGFSAVMNTALPRKRMIAHVLIRDATGRILFCDTRFKLDWELPGGIVEPNESPRLAAIREVREELGIELSVGRLLAVDWMPPYLGWEDACELIFDGGLVDADELATFTLQPSEIAAVHLLDLEAAAEHLTPLSARRLAAICALGPGKTVLLENGSPVTAESTSD